MTLVAVTLVATACADSLRDGDRALKAGRLEQALKSYQSAADQGLARGEAGVGHVWMRRGQYEKALDAFRRAQKIDPGLAAAYYGQGEVYRRQGKCQDAIPLLENATRLDRKFPEAQLALGRCLVASGQFDRGIDELNRGLKTGRTWAPQFLVARGTAWMSRDSLRKAGIDFTRARELAPNDPTIRMAIGDFYLQRGTWSLAVPELQAAVALDSSNTEAQYSLGQALFYAQRYDEALDTYRRLIVRDPDFAPGQLGLGDLLYRAGAADTRRFAEAKVPLTEYTRLEPEDAKGWSLLGRTYFRLGERDSALRCMLEAQRLGDTNKELYTMMGLAYADRREWARALDAFTRGDPGPHELLTLAQVYDVTGHPAQADSIYREFLARDSISAGAAFAYSERGKIRFRDKDYPEAVTLFSRASALDSLNGEAAFFRGLSLKEMNRDAEALVALRQAATIDSTKADRFFWFGVLADRQRHLDEAERAFQRCAELDSSGDLAGKSCRQLGYYRLLGKRWADAISYLTRATKLDPKDAQAWVWLGQGYQNAGNRDKAAECYRTVLTIDPGNTSARKGLKSLSTQAPAVAERRRHHAITKEK